MKTVAVLGAGGFIGSRLVEVFHLNEIARVRPIVRTWAHRARIARFALDTRMSDARDERALSEAFAGCDTVVHAIAGSAEVITDAIVPSYRAAEKAKVRRLIYLSSGSVHGQSPPAGTTEESPLSSDQPIPYNNAKVRAEELLRALRKEGAVEMVILRPGIVLGPRSYWVGAFADGLLRGNAYLINGGRGICNSIYVDNLIQAIELAMKQPGADGQSFLLGDAEVVTWAEVYRPIAEALGIKWSDVPEIPPNLPPEASIHSRRVQSGATTGTVSFLDRVRRAIVAALHRTPKADSTGAGPSPTFEESLLYTCAYKLPHRKAQDLLGYSPAISFAEGSRRTIAWLEFAGYPVLPSTFAGAV